jgi:hypothetical protein
MEQLNPHLRPAPYSNTDEPETLATDIFESLLDHEKVKADIKKRDKYPNIDGYIDLVDEKRIPIGKLEVQIRKLPDNYTSNPKIQCELSLFSYSEAVTCNPVLLIGVDTTQKKAYWVHIARDLISDLAKKEGQETKIILFPNKNVIEGEDTRYIEEWKNIVNNYRIKMQEYDKLKDSYIKLSKNANPALGMVKEDFQNIHIFLDEINRVLDGKFSIIKGRFYPNAWKIGLTYYEYQNNSISYTLYPIPFDKNDVQIKEVDKKLHQQLELEGLGFTTHFVENPIKFRPKEYATEIIESKVLKILGNKILDHKGNEFLAREFIFAFIDKFSQQLGLGKKDAYSLEEIEPAFFQYLPLWVKEAVNFMVKVQRNGVKAHTACLYRGTYFDPAMLICQIMNDEREKIDQSVRAKLKENVPILNMPISNDKFPFWIFIDFLSFLKSQGIMKINRVYSPKDYSRLKMGGGWVWNVFSPEAAERNLRIFFENLPEVYDALVSQNFPELRKELPLFGDASKILINFDVKEVYTSFQDAPTIQFLYLKGKNQDEFKIEMYKKGQNEDIPNISHVNFERAVEFNGGKYNLISWSTGILDFIYEDLPMFNFVYKTLEENLKGYFDNSKQG